MDNVDVDDIVRTEPDELQTVAKLPVTFRSAAMQQHYTNALMLGSTLPLDQETSLMEFRHWRIIDNRFPYDMLFRRSHMLMPYRVAANRADLTPEEVDELHDILDGYVNDNYDGYFVSSVWKRSNTSHYHVHLLDYVGDRSEVKL